MSDLLKQPFAIRYSDTARRVKPGGTGDGDDDESSTSSSSSSSDADGDDSDSDGDGGPRKLAAMTMEEVTNELIMMQQLSGHPNIVTVKEFFTEGAVAPAATPSSAAATAATAEHRDPSPHETTGDGTPDDTDGTPTAPPEGTPAAEGTVHVVMELLRGQELVDVITEVGTYAESDAKVVMSNMLDAIAFMHARGVVHRDLKLENLVLSRPDDLTSVTLVDFGLAKALMARERAENVCGTLAYVAPEALAAGQYGQGVDVWALGVAMHALLTGTWPFDDEDEDELMDAIIACDLDFEEGEEWAGISPEAKDLLRGLLDPNPKHRLSAAQALEHAWFTGRRQNTSERLHHVHARLDALVGSSRQHPVRISSSDDFIILSPSSFVAVCFYFYFYFFDECTGTCFKVFNCCQTGKKQLAPESSSVLVRYLWERRFKPGARLVRQGHPSDEVFVITAGECEVVVVATDEAEAAAALAPAQADASELPSKRSYLCEACEDDYSQWHDQCPGCKTWESFRKLTPEEEQEREKETAEEASTTCEEPPPEPRPARKSNSVAWKIIGRRRKGNLVGEIPHAPHDASRTHASAVPLPVTPVPRAPRHDAGPPCASPVTVIAKTEVRALVFDRADVEWATGHDYRLSDEFECALRERRRRLVRQSRLAARAERERAEQGGGKRATSEMARRRN